MTTCKCIRGTQTEKNLVVAYLTESAAYSRYMFYGKKAEKEGYYAIARLFAKTADNELRHAKVFFKYLRGGAITVTHEVNAGVIGTTLENLAAAAYEELVEGLQLYQEFAKVAKQEGFDDIASHFYAIAEVEDRHRCRFLRYHEQVEQGTVWHRDHEITWKCLVCGYEHHGAEPPTNCPACDHSRQHFKAKECKKCECDKAECCRES